MKELHTRVLFLMFALCNFGLIYQAGWSSDRPGVNLNVCTLKPVILHLIIYCDTTSKWERDKVIKENTIPSSNQLGFVENKFK